MISLKALLFPLSINLLTICGQINVFTHMQHAHTNHKVHVEKLYTPDHDKPVLVFFHSAVIKPSTF
jgi:hypothetical protein